MLWIEAVRGLSADLDEPFALEFVWRELSNLTKLDWLNLMRTDISADALSNLTEIARRLANHEPAQYLIGWAEFCGLRFQVDERVLIPRPETEELVRLILAENSEAARSVLDIGTGSGAIAISLAQQRANWRVTASDISSEALELAQHNATAHQVSVKFDRSDVLDNFTEKFDIIVSNPPYIAISDEAEVDESVKKFEPQNALFAENDGLAIYQKIAAQAPSNLTEQGKLYLEIGYKQGSAVQAIFEAAFPDKTVSVLRDSFGKERMVRVQ